MVIAMAAFAVEDVFVKAAAASIPVAQVLIIFGVGGALIFACFARANRDPLFSADVVSRPMCVRALFEVAGRLFYVLAISLSSLSAATVILQATPLVVVSGASLFFGERVGWLRWLAICIGFVGVVVIVKPGTESFSGYSVLAVLGMIGFAGRDLASRAAPRSLSSTILGLYGFISLIVAGCIYALWEGKPFVLPDSRAVLYLVGAVLFGCAAYFGLMKAMRTGEVSAVAPFRYTRLIFGVALGVLLFDERLTASMFFGVGLIVCSGVFLLYRREAGSA